MTTQDKEIMNHGAIGSHSLGTYTGRVRLKVIETQLRAVFSAFRQEFSPEQGV